MSAKPKEIEPEIIDGPGQSVAVVPTTPMEMVALAVQRGASMETLERLQAMQERWEANQARKAFDEAIANAKAEIPPIIRNAKGHNEKKYVSFDAIAKVVDPIITKHGLSYRFRTEQGDRINVTCVLRHKSGHHEETTLAGPADTTGNKNAIQAIGSTLTYLQRYSLVQMLGLAASDDDDGKNSGPGGTVTDEQADTIRRLITETNSNIEAFLKVMGAESVSDIPAAKFAEAVAKLETKKSRQGRPS